MVFLLTAAAVVWIWAQVPYNPLPPGVEADFVRIDKSARRLTLFRQGRPLKSYTVALGRIPQGQKQRQGDNRTPEGRYHIDGRNNRSKFYKALHISYPNGADKARARQHGWSPGGAILIHGLPPALGWVGRLHRFRDWTAGCGAVTKWEMDEIWRAVPRGTKVEIKP
jgi:murein L,D-transpeptidase YafK